MFDSTPTERLRFHLPAVQHDFQAQPALLLPTTVGPVQLALVTASQALGRAVRTVCDSCCEALPAPLGGSA
ncbi:hypothetical protein RTH46_18255 [Pseudomonas sp. zfem004]|uniref:hypothetical protein n=1 Tax=Pseudomonas sp. zfem004 TaxID=3078199 RepID=UPI00292A1CE8|nr:hypothetical protein [Pseudomonas sp. zfem004]MDU9404436.1 hypothetical protein [Pseudomonas sp. zfem004]